mmetsp:Transcript_11831/g.28226  ORF Transcript_11831/g.28226 Transcript_11831/m.28226 type:complete len:139 (-) Transcript_11831:51-467(-)|eukprot:s4106_g1.t1
MAIAAMASLRTQGAGRLPMQLRCFCSGGTSARPKIQLATSDQIVGFTVKEYKGLVMGSTVRAKDVTKDFASSIRAVFGGELPHYTQLMQDAREEAICRMEDEAAKLGANAVISLRLSSTNIAATTSEVMVYGTAVVVE